MNYLTAFLLVVAVCSLVSASLITPQQGDSQNSLVPAQRQQIDLFASSRRLIEQLIETLRKAAREAYDVIARFSTTVQEEATSVRERIVTDIQKLRGRVSNVIETVRNRLIDSGVGIIECIASQSGDANVIFNETLTKTMSCVDERILDVGDQISSLRTLSDSALDFGNKTLEDMMKCAEDRENLIATGTCLGAIAIQSEMKALIFATQSALVMGRINLSIAMLPASLEVCAGSRLVDTGMATGRILMEIGTCSATSVFNAMTGNVEL